MNSLQSRTSFFYRMLPIALLLLSVTGTTVRAESNNQKNKLSNIETQATVAERNKKQIKKVVKAILRQPDCGSKSNQGKAECERAICHARFKAGIIKDPDPNHYDCLWTPANPAAPDSLLGTCRCR